MKKHFGILDFLFSYIASGLILVVVFAALLKIGATEDSIGKFTEDHKSTLNFIQAYIAYRITEWWLGGRMTCMKQEFCIHEKYCQRHIGQNFDSCILFSRNSKPMTNEEWLRSCDTEQLAEWILDVSDECFDCGKSDNGDCPFGKAQGVCTCINKDSVVEWLKQPHTNE